VTPREQLVESLRRTFARRATAIQNRPIEGLSDPFASDPLQPTRWRAFFAKGQLQVDAADFTGVVAEVRRFAQSSVDAARDDTAFDNRWPAGGPRQRAASPAQNRRF
jgi:hypothetical protein